MTKKMEWIKHLDRVERLARGGRWRRLRHAPGRYFFGQFFQKVIYPLRPLGLPVLARTFWGRKMQIILPAAMDIFLLGAKTHNSELRLARFLIDRLKEGDRVADIGAHYGFFSLLAAELVGPAGRVEAFEATGSTCEVLQKNVAGMPQVQARHLAISNVGGELDFYEFPTRYTEYNTLYPEQFKGQQWFERRLPQVRKVPAISFDDFCRTNQFQPTLIKIDVEGAEDRVIAGMEKLLTSIRPVIVMEYLAEDRLNPAHRRAVELLRALGYASRRITEAGKLESCADIEAYLNERNLDSDNLVFVIRQ